MYGIILRGMAVGITETVPGISGSTVAMILGIYERLINSISLLTTRRRREAYSFLFKFGIGLAAGFVVSLLLIDYFLTNHRFVTLLFFTGIIVGFLPFFWQETVALAKRNIKAKHYIILLIFFLIVVLGQMSGGIEGIDINNLTMKHYIFFFVSGIIASTALIAPGISGALILTILGVYEIAKDALLAFNMPIVISIGAGVVIGLLVVSRFIRYLLRTYPVPTYVAMVGLVAGSIFAIIANIEGPVTTGTVVVGAITFIAGVTLSVVLKRLQLKQVQ